MIRLPFEERPFVAWDTEGISYTPGQAQATVLLGHSDGPPLIGRELRTVEMLEWCLSQDCSDTINVAYSFKYDTNQILRDLSDNALRALISDGVCKWRHYTIEYRPGKWLSVASHGRFWKVFDVIGYFQQSFAKTVEQYLGKSDPDYAIIVEGKAKRGAFTYDEIEYIEHYWAAEQRALVKVMTILRKDFHDAKVIPNSWHGPAASVAALYKSKSIHDYMGSHSEEVAFASRLAYAGGRFEAMQVGFHDGPVYEYDLNSAYPAAMRYLPDLSHGEWVLTEKFDPTSFGMWWIEHSEVGGYINPLFVRDRHGSLSWPQRAEGMYWTPEARLVNEKEIKWGWVWITESTIKPFAYVPDMYSERQKLKEEGKSAERALKLLLNSSYGKLAQRIGWTLENGRVPPFHQLQWAGFITSFTRYLLMLAMRQSPANIIACETDAVFSTVPLELPLSKELGEWGQENFDNILYLQSGFYFANVGWNEKGVDKARGFDRGSVNASDAFLAIRSHTDWTRNPILTGNLTRYVTMGLAQHTSLPWRAWLTTPHDLRVGGSVKRPHLPRSCRLCRDRVSLADTMHRTTVWCRPECEGTAWWQSQPHDIPWANTEIDPESFANMAGMVTEGLLC